MKKLNDPRMKHERLDGIVVRDTAIIQRFEGRQVLEGAARFRRRTEATRKLIAARRVV